MNKAALFFDVDGTLIDWQPRSCTQMQMLLN